LLTLAAILPTLADMKAKLAKWEPEDGKDYELRTVGNVGVKIYRRERKKLDGSIRYVYEVADYSTGIRRMLGFSDLAKARKKGDTLAGLVSSGDIAAAQLRGPQVASYGRAVELIRPTGDSLELAASRYAEAVKILGNGSKLVEAAEAFVIRQGLPDKTVAEVVQEMLAEKTSKGREKRTLDDLRNRLTRFAGDFQCPIATVTKSDIQQWLDKLGTSERDKLNFRSKVGTLFKWAWRRDYVLLNPVEKTEKPEADNGEIEIYSAIEMQRLIDAATRHCKDYLPCLLIGGFAGLRSSEIERLTWEDISLTRGYIKASAKKRGTPSRRLVPIQPNLAAWLADYADKKGLVWTGKHDQFSDAQQEVAEATRINADTEKGIEAAEPVAWKHNGLRHSFISYRLAILQDDAKTALEAGNSKDMLHQHYKELATPEEAKVWFDIAPETPANVTSLKGARV
jgi:integrase